MFSKSVDFEEGILQTIGFKEFLPYLEKHDRNEDRLINEFVASAKTTSEPEGWKILQGCLQELKSVTQRYSKKQQKWIRNRFLGSDDRNVPPIYPLGELTDEIFVINPNIFPIDTSDVTHWDEMVSKPAQDTVESYIANRKIVLNPMEKLNRINDGFSEETSHHCSICDRIFIGDFQWQLHIKSNRHKRSREKKVKDELKKVHKSEATTAT